MRKTGFILAIFFVAVLITGCSTGFTSGDKGGVTSGPKSTSSGGPINGLVQSSDGGAVTIDVEWLGESKNALVFDVTMDTHSVDLDRYDLGKLAVLQDDQGKEYRPISWDAASGGHHRSGKLAFAVPSSLSQGQTKSIELIIRDIAGVKERILKWRLG